MRDAGQQSGEGARSTEGKKVWSGVRLIILIILSASCLILQFLIIPKFEQFYRDALPGMALPIPTQFIITARMLFALIDLGWPILGTLLIRQQRHYAILWINVGILWTLLQIGITIIALFIPLIGIESGVLKHS